MYSTWGWLRSYKHAVHMRWLDTNKRVLGTRRVSGNSLVVQAASITTLDQPLHFAVTTNFALI